jgi:hypothetical protein
LNIAQLETIPLKDIKQYFEFSNGKMFVKPFTVKAGDINMQIGGTQGFDKTMDYVINMKLPRALLGAKGNQLINNLAAQANSKGIPVTLSDIINLNLGLGGTITNPTVKTDLSQTAGDIKDQLKQQATEYILTKIDSTKKLVQSAIKDTIASVKQQLKEDALKKLLGGSSDSTKPKTDLKQSAKGLMKNLFNR